MILSLVQALLLQLIQADPNLKPQYETGIDRQCTSNLQPGVTQINLQITIPFTAQFQYTPKIILSQIELASTTSLYLLANEFSSATKTSFTYNCILNKSSASHVYVQWLAFLDDNLFVKYGGIQFPTSQTTFSLQFHKVFNNPPVVTIFTTGGTNINIQGPFNYYIKVGTTTTSQANFQLIKTGSLITMSFGFLVVYGDSTYFKPVYIHQSLSTPIPSFSVNSGQIIIAGQNEISVDKNGATMVTSIDSTTTPGTITYTRTITGTSNLPTNTFTLTYFIYSPCPLYCTCSVPPTCDVCLPGTQRTLPNNCQTCPVYMFAHNSYYNCQQCMKICDSCTTATTCTACLTGSLRSTPPLCNQCPLRMFLQAGNLICQSCSSYCDSCQYESNHCTACKVGTDRINPPSCTQCQLASYYIPIGGLNCLSCNIYCDGCLNGSNFCLACLGGTQRIYPPFCSTRPNQMFAITTIANCQACSTYCNNCQLTSTTCTSCQISTYRLNPPNCSTCPPNMFILSGQDICQQCNPLCNQCITTANTCLACNGLYRTNAPNCDQCSMPNYYIDSLLNDCQLCASYCKGCQTSSTNCISCWPFTFQQLSLNCADCPVGQFTLPLNMCYIDPYTQICSKNYNRDDRCNCLDGFFNSENSLSCLKCSNICQTCTTSATNCIICNSSLNLLPPTCNSCINGYFMLQGSCTQCSNSCITCSQSSTLCLNCASPCINPPLCSCAEGYFNDCTQSCGIQCKSCNISSTNCVTCAGNRINPPLCECPDGSLQSTSICSQCSLAEPIVRFTDNLDSIEIIFTYKLVNLITCKTLLNQKTLIDIGTNSVCTVQSNVIIITLGTNATITVNQPIFILPDTVQFQTCKQAITNIITALVQAPQKTNLPKLKFNKEQFITTPCDVVSINIIGSTYSAQRNLKLIGWNIISATNTINLSSLINKWNTLDLQNSYIITPDYLRNQQSIQLMITYSNFIGQVSNSTIQISITNERLELIVNVPSTVYVFDIVQLSLVAQLQQCILRSSSEMFQVQIVIQNSSNSLSQNYTLQSEIQQILSFDPFQLAPSSTYYIHANAQYKGQRILVEQYFYVSLADIQVNILGGDQIIGINQEMKIEAVVLNPNEQTLVNDLKQYQTIWGCINIVTNQQCNNFYSNSFTANLSTSDYQSFTTLFVTIQVYNKSQQQIASNNITVQIVENEVTQIQLTGNQYQLNQPLNSYDEVDVQISFSKQINIDVDNLTYYASYLDDSYQQNQIQFYNPQTSIIMLNFHQVKTAKFKVMVYLPSQKGPSVATLNIRMNIPPQQCKISIFSRASKFQVQINSCISQSQPLSYQFDSINGLIINGIKLSDYQVQATLITYLYGQNTSLIVGFIKDSANGLSNTSYSLKNYQTIDSTLLYYMLQDSQVNLPRNIMFIMKYASLNNQILNDKYYNQILNISNTFNQTNKITQYIQQQLAAQQSLSDSQITQSISTTTSHINNIQAQLNYLQEQQNSNQYNKNYQFQLINLQNELSDSTNKISFLYAQSQLVENRRLLDSASAKNVTSLITETISNVTDILGQLTKVNQNPKAISTPQFNLTAQKFSTSNINQNFKLQIVNQTNQTVQYKNQNFNVNPYQNESDFNNTVKAPLIVPNLTDSKNVQINPANPIPFDFAPVADSNVSCASKVGGSWSMDLCQIVKSSTKLQCLCQTLSPLSIVQALQFILQQFDKLFQDKIIDSLTTFPYAQALFTYIIALFVTIYFVFMFILYRKDHFDKIRVYPIDTVQKTNSPNKIQVPPPSGITKNFREIMDNQEDILYTKTSVIGQVKDQKITKIQGFKIYVQNSHVLFELYYRYDSEEPRVLRLSILFLQMVGQICIFVLFGKNLAISIVIALSIFQTVYGVLFQLILSQMIKSKNKLFHYWA